MNPFLGLIFHWLGGLASASFYLPYRAVRKWSWETYWLVGGFFSWIIAPVLLASALTNHLVGVLQNTDSHTLFWTYFFGVLWGLGGLTFGLTMRYLGMSLGMAVALGYCAAFGTLMPPIFRGELFSKILSTTSGLVILAGVMLCLVGIAIAGAAGVDKEKTMSEKEKRSVIKEFNFKKGILVATFSGVMSACFSYGLAAGDPIKVLTVAAGTPKLWQGLPVLVVVLLGGFTTNFIWCILLNIKNRSGGEYLGRPAGAANASGLPIIETTTDAPGEEVARRAGGTLGNAVAPIGLNYLFSMIAGVTWYLQFFFYTMGESQMGRYSFASWTLHMASIIIFSSLWGLALKEWRGASAKAMRLLFVALAVLVGSTVVIGWGTYLAQQAPMADQAPKS